MAAGLWLIQTVLPFACCSAAYLSSRLPNLVSRLEGFSAVSFQFGLLTFGNTPDIQILRFQSHFGRNASA
jgi:hypothetical protein